MACSILATIIARLLRKPRLTCPDPLWSTLLEDLRNRGEGRRESGAFLLGHVHHDGRRSVAGYMLYDDIDPKALRGWIEFDGSKMDAVWKRCEAEGMSVVADVHTHPGGYGQSDTDQANPMMPLVGHVALIIPQFAARRFSPTEIGVYEFCGPGRWRDNSGTRTRFFALEAAQ